MNSVNRESKTNTRIITILFLVLTFSNSLQAQQTASPPALLTYNELLALYETDPPSAELSNKLTRLLTTPIVNNSSGVRGPRVIKTSASEGGALRVATWNIERGLEFDAVKAALTNDKRFFRRLPLSMRGSGFNLSKVLEQAAELSRADIIVLNEVDWGLKRTNYRNVVRELATAMQMSRNPSTCGLVAACRRDGRSCAER